ncbi:phage tail domain-containing protein [Bacillus altitudinis]|uniref:phage tail domain-containing protein n=1 Tax=Bacillus altitudinis TaxID=293387 RepID=UPI002DB5D416|nr:phage tail domain-containing protein [Bacillus altitudinis]MEC1142302.1 phage tail family protein [Bacillus altitudinis]
MELYIDFNNGLGEQSLNDLLPHFHPLSLTPASPIVEFETVSLQRINGIVLPQHPRDVKYKERQIQLEIYMNSIIAENFYSYRSELYALLVKPFPYYISCDLLPNRRFLVTCEGNFTTPKEKEKNHVVFSVEFTDVLGAAESKSTSLNPQTFEGERWSPGMNIEIRDDLEYSFKNKKTFSIYNIGDFRINPLRHDYQVTLKAKGKGVTIINHTTGERLKIEDELTKSREVSFVKQYTIANKKRLKTSGRLPSLDIGRNDFEIQNASDIEIVFDTRFYYA